MSFSIRCYTLFEFAHTGHTYRHRPVDIEFQIWSYNRNLQCNFDTILQIISMRSQPEIITAPHKTTANSMYFGNYYSSLSDVIECWSFTFSIQHASVFENGISHLGALYNDCSNVPMIQIGNSNSVILCIDDEKNVKKKR